MSYLERHVYDLDVVAAPLAEQLDLGHLGDDGLGTAGSGGPGGGASVVPVFVHG